MSLRCMRGQRSSTSIASEWTSTYPVQRSCIEPNHSQSIRPMPRASERAERIMGQLSEVRDNMRKLSEHLKEVSETMSPLYLLPTEFSTQTQTLQGLPWLLSLSFKRRSGGFVLLALR